MRLDAGSEGGEVVALLVENADLNFKIFSGL
jgi:hypothetical protein